MTLTLSTIGGAGGIPFSFTGESNAATLVKIGVWVGEWQVKAVHVWLSDGKNQIFGQTSGPYQEYSLKPAERFASLSLWGNGDAVSPRLGAIKFKTNQGKEFFAKMTNRSLPQENIIDVGSGISLGVVGRGGSDIDSMGFMFLK